MAKVNSTAPQESSLNVSPIKGRAKRGENPHFNNAERAPFELGQLLLELPRFGSQIERGDKDGVQRAEAAVRHATNAKSTLLYGLESLGKCMFIAGASDSYELKDSEIADLGCLIRHIATELHMLDGVVEEFGEVARGAA